MTAAALFSFPARAQEQTDYTPPPMFGDAAPMKRPEGPTGNLFAPRTSVRTPENTAPVGRPAAITTAPQNATPVTQPPAASTIAGETPPETPVAPSQNEPKPQPASTPPATPPRMMQPIIDERDLKRQTGTPKPSKPVEQKTADPAPAKPEKKEAVENTTVTTPVAPEKKPVAPVVAEPEKPVQQPPKQDVTQRKTDAPIPPPSPAPASDDDRTQPVKAVRDPNVSAIKGPKTMPSLPMESVDVQKTFDTPDVPEEQTILERHQHEIETAKSSDVPAAVAPPPGVVPATFDTDKKDILKKVIPYQAGQVGLEKGEAQSIAAGVAEELGLPEKEQWRAQIRSYATSFGSGLSSDRRIALSRALSLRTHLIESGVPASRIDVLAEGMDKNATAAPDRVDLFLFGPSAK